MFVEKGASMGKVFRILSIDGGGVRGMIPATFLKRIEQQTGRPIHDLFDLIAGTSTGGILTMGLTIPATKGSPAAKYQVDDGIRLYREEGPRIFERTLMRTIRTVRGLMGPKYSETPMMTVLREYFGEAYLSETLTDIVITSYNIEKRDPWFFRTLRARSRADYDFPLVEVARATSAAPTNFSPTRIKAADGTAYTLVDGGVFANNPAMVAYVDALSLYADTGYDSIMVISMGTGRCEKSIPYAEARNWGLIGWGLPAIDILKTGANESADYQMQQVLNKMTQQADNAEATHHYYRLQVELNPGEDSMDDASKLNLDRLETAAKRYIDDNEGQFERMCNQLLQGLTEPA